MAPPLARSPIFADLRPLTVIGETPDGLNINLNVGSTLT